MVVGLNEKGEVEEIVPPIVEVRPGGVVEPVGGVVLVGEEEGVHDEGVWGERERRGGNEERWGYISKRKEDEEDSAIA